MRDYSKHTKRQIESIATDKASQYDSQLIDNAVYEAISFDEQLADLIELINEMDELQFQRSRSVDDSRQDPIVEGLRSARFDLDQSEMIEIRADEIEQQTLRDLYDQVYKMDEDDREEALIEIESEIEVAFEEVDN